MKKYNILFLTSWYPNKHKPQAGNFIQNHALSVSLFCNVYVIHVRANEQDEELEIVETMNNDVLELVAYYKKYTGKFPLISTLIKFRNKIRAYKKTYKYLIEKVKSIDLVHLSVFLPAGVFARFLFKKYKIPYIITEHWTKFLSIFLLLNGITSGALVYFIPRENILKLLIISYLWTIITIIRVITAPNTRTNTVFIIFFSTITLFVSVHYYISLNIYFRHFHNCIFLWLFQK